MATTTTEAAAACRFDRLTTAAARCFTLLAGDQGFGQESLDTFIAEWKRRAAVFEGTAQRNGARVDPQVAAWDSLYDDLTHCRWRP